MGNLSLSMAAMIEVPVGIQDLEFTAIHAVLTGTLLSYDAAGPLASDSVID